MRIISGKFKGRKINYTNLRSVRPTTDRTKESLFNYKVKIPTKKYLKMIKSRYISCLLNMNNKDLMKGIAELRFKHSDKINFTDTLKCISFKN